MRYFCPNCWSDFAEDLALCPQCGQDIVASWKAKDYGEKLIAALDHPEQETPIRAAWILGKLRDERAVEPLIALVGKTHDVYIASAAVEALGLLGTPRAREFLRGVAAGHPAAMVRQVACAAAAPELHCSSRRDAEMS
jgi:HEAT repeat protein